MKMQTVVMEKVYEGEKYDKFIVKSIENNDQFICSANQEMNLEVGNVYDMDISFRVGSKQHGDKKVMYQLAFISWVSMDEKKKDRS